MTCTINWNVLSFTEWEQRFKTISRSNLLQSYPYAQAMREIHGQTSRFGLITIDGQDAGMVQILEAGLFKNLIHALIIDRGPLWFDGFGSLAHQTAFIKEINRQFPARFARKRRFIPEMPDNAETLSILKAHNFIQKTQNTYETLWLDLRQDSDILRQNLKKNWRGALQKAERQDFQIEWDDQGKHFAWLIQNYMQDRIAKGYDGPSVKLLKALAKYMVPRRDMIIGRVMSNAKPIAGVMILTHGSSATYQIGYTSNAGRDSGAHHIVLWQALSYLQGRGIQDFDLGGINDETAKGVKKFKQGMGGSAACLCGLFT